MSLYPKGHQSCHPSKSEWLLVSDLQWCSKENQNDTIYEVSDLHTSDLVFYNIKMPQYSCPLGSSLLLTGAIKWGTVQTSTSTSTGIMKGQS